MIQKRVLGAVIFLIVLLALTLNFTVPTNDAKANYDLQSTASPSPAPAFNLAPSATPKTIIKYVILPSQNSPSEPTETPATDTYIYPEVLGTINSTDLLPLLQQAFKIDTLKSFNGFLFINDKTLALTSVEQAKNYTAGDRKYNFSVEGHDCDNFAYQLLGYWSQGDMSFAFGYAETEKHAFNIFIDENLDVYVVEPTTNEFILYETVKEAKSPEYFPIMVCIV